MLTYNEVYAHVKELIREPRPQFVQESYESMAAVFRKTAESLRNPIESIELPTWTIFNRLIGGGLRPHEFSILCGPTGAGKTSLLSNIAAELNAIDEPIFVASVEIGSEDFLKKMLSIVSGVSLEDIKPETCDEYKKSFSSSGTVFSTYDSRVSHLQLMCDIYHAHKTKGVRVALVDNLNFLMDVSDDKNQITQMDTAVHEFVVFCKKLPIHVIMVMHPRKTADGRVESEFDIKGSSTAVQEASNVFLFNRLKNKEEAPMGCTPQLCREIKLAKVRKNGRSVGFRILYETGTRHERYSERAVL